MTERASLRIPVHLSRWLNAKAKAEKKTFSRTVIEILEQAMREVPHNDSSIYSKAALIGICHAGSKGDPREMWRRYHMFMSYAGKSSEDKKNAND